MATTTGPNTTTTDAVPSAVKLTTLFGEREFVWDKAIYFPAGLKGFPDHNVFPLARCPGESGNAFLLMQCLTEPDLAFLVDQHILETAEAVGDHIARPEHRAQIFEGRGSVADVNHHESAHGLGGLQRAL